ncbi:MAG: hypothetical protein U5K76_02770 [Woeseiaceae bacterium]|nr:hypothetical protein [Woeseiaceae bacterium]
MKSLYKDFGDVFDEKYDGTRGFWRWWTEPVAPYMQRGEFLILRFSPKVQLLNDAAFRREKSGLEGDDAYIFRVPKALPKTVVLEQIERELEGVNFEPKRRSKPRYSIVSEKVDIARA